jgi:prepilin-type N-terminal cleavage/methylation domain-containing protein
MNMSKVSHSPKCRTGFMLIEVLVALAIFGLSAVYLVDGAFVASRTIRLMKDARELEQDLLWVRSQVLAEPSYEKFEEGGELTALSMGEIEWEAEVEMTEVLDLYRVKLILQYDGNDDFNIEPGERVTEMLLLRPTWGKHADFSTERNRLLEDKRDKVRELKEERRRKQ